MTFTTQNLSKPTFGFLKVKLQQSLAKKDKDKYVRNNVQYIFEK